MQGEPSETVLELGLKDKQEPRGEITTEGIMYQSPEVTQGLKTAGRDEAGRVHRGPMESCRQPGEAVCSDAVVGFLSRGR